MPLMLTEFDKPPKWVWVRCTSPFCNHARAIAIAPGRIRWGEEDAFAMLRQKMRCGVCGRRGAAFDSPEPDWRGANGSKHFAPEYFPAGPLHMAGERLTIESFAARDARILAAYLARYPCGDAIRTVDGMCNLYSHTSNKEATWPKCLQQRLCGRGR